jgi:hypothetical protein
MQQNNHCYSGKSVIITCSKCVSAALGIQHVTHLRHIVTCGLPGSTIFFHASQTAVQKVIEHKMCVLNFSTNLTETVIILRKTERDIIKQVHWV